MSLLFSSYTLNSPRGPLELVNRIVVAPMCQYSAHNGEATDWHLMHWGNLLNSGAALFIIEATGVTPEGRITPACLGLWDDRTEAALKDKLSRARKLAPAIPVFIQLAHAGRKASSATPWEGGQLLSTEQGGWETLAPSAIPQLEGERLPHELSKSELKQLIDDFVIAAKRAERIGLDGIELHGAHGYLLHQFLSPIANQRKDEYGGSFENRIRFPLELFAAVRAAYQGVLGIRISASDWIEGGWDLEQTTDFTRLLKQAGADFVHVSSGGISPQQKTPEVCFSSKLSVNASCLTPPAQLIASSIGRKPSNSTVNCLIAFAILSASCQCVFATISLSKAILTGSSPAFRQRFASDCFLGFFKLLNNFSSATSGSKSSCSDTLPV